MDKKSTILLLMIICLRGESIIGQVGVIHNHPNYISFIENPSGMVSDDYDLIITTAGMPADNELIETKAGIVPTDNYLIETSAGSKALDEDFNAINLLSLDILDHNINGYLINPNLFPEQVISPDQNDKPYDFRRIARQRIILSSGLLFLSGFSDGTSEVLKIKYESFDRVLPGANPQFWDYRISWVNKYKDGSPPDAEFLGAKSAFVWTTDGYHLMRMIRNSTMIVAVTIPINSGFRKPWQSYVKEGVIYYLAYTAGFNFAYDVVFE